MFGSDELSALVKLSLVVCTDTVGELLNNLERGDPSPGGDGDGDGQDEKDPSLTSSSPGGIRVCDAVYIFGEHPDNEGSQVLALRIFFESILERLLVMPWVEREAKQVLGPKLKELPEEPTDALQLVSDRDTLVSLALRLAMDLFERLMPVVLSTDDEGQRGSGNAGFTHIKQRVCQEVIWPCLVNFSTKVLQKTDFGLPSFINQREAAVSAAALTKTGGLLESHWAAHMESRVKAVPLPETEKIVHTLNEARALLGFCHEHEFKTLVICAPTFHLPRCFVTTVSALKEETQQRGRLTSFNVFCLCGTPLPWTAFVTHNQGKVCGTRLQILEGELERLRLYHEKGDLLRPSEALQWFVEHRSLN
uniref:Uncharacterized protein n=1 Tax=Chromera velia CCMP2878 TaxID=1169474 RepID=A0A0G4EYY5_9ALVE|eukprot:Cvel_14286.t1-p1 / transcript=Cvel_14286.t1 / gene=Cvel_14286 / organism=Chromera_velia_CCMP2878 / gene_product=hypothetical protein / transcript_product=hypothetical protein / location=Cvel_scaffold1009:10059-11147(-) / protein_length=363 / sequence_SO=supercontig / SO=protein_coding / is_pseudo=false